MVGHAGQQIRHFYVADHGSEARSGPSQESFQPICEFADKIGILTSRRHLDNPFPANKRKGVARPCGEGVCFVPIGQKFIPNGSKRGGQKRTVLDKGAANFLSIMEFFEEPDLILQFCWRPCPAQCPQLSLRPAVAFGEPAQQRRPDFA